MKYLMGKQDRMLTIDGEYIHIDSVESKTFMKRGKAAVSYHISEVMFCKTSKKNNCNVKMAIQKLNDNNKMYEFEAPTSKVACTFNLI
jgi:hypothetical protein